MLKAKKRSLDPMADELLVKAAKDNTRLSWDMHEENLPHCGFGEMGLCCTKCMQGPCRIDPFGNNVDRGSCGRDAAVIAAENLSLQFLSGLSSAAEELKDTEILKEAQSLYSYLNGGMNLDAEEVLQKTFDHVEKVYSKLDLSSENNIITNKLDLNKKKVVISGKVSKEAVNMLKKQKDVEVYSLLNEFYYEDVKPLTNYGSQEFIVMSGFPDLLVFGSGCAKPVLLELADKYDVDYVYESDLSEFDLNDVESSGYMEIDYLDFNLKNDYEDKLSEADKIALVAGCNNVKYSQDNRLKKLTEHLLYSGYTVLTSGCAAMGLNKYFSEDDEIYYFGSCNNTTAFSEIAEKYADSRKVVAVFPELSQMKAFSQAAYLAKKGVKTYVMSKSFIPPYPEFKNLIKNTNPDLRIKTEGYKLEQISGILD